MKQKFIRFLKENHAFKEFNAATDFTFNEVWNTHRKHSLLLNGVVILYKNGLSDIDWEDLNYKWVEVIKTEEAR